MSDPIDFASLFPAEVSPVPTLPPTFTLLQEQLNFFRVNNQAIPAPYLVLYDRLYKEEQGVARSELIEGFLAEFKSALEKILLAENKTLGMIYLNDAYKHLKQFMEQLVQ